MKNTNKKLYRISIWKTISTDYDDRVEKIADDIYRYAKDYLDLKKIGANILRERHLRDHDEGNYFISYGWKSEEVIIKNPNTLKRYEQLQFDL